LVWRNCRSDKGLCRFARVLGFGWDMEIRAFRGFRYDAGVAGDPGRCVAPPYDVIGEQQRQMLYARSPYNIVRIIRGKAKADGQDQYAQAAEYFRRWIEGGVLRQDSAESIYGYVQDFELGGERLQRLTFVAAGKLEDFGAVVRPHERILDEPMQDRLNLTRATEAQFGLVFMLYRDPERVADEVIRQAAEAAALVDYTDEQAVRHRLFGITGQRQIDAIVEMMRDKSVIIADGHHRYTTGLRYAAESGKASARYQMIAFTNTEQPGLVVLATHRLVGGVGGFEINRLVGALEKNFAVRAFAFGGRADKAAARERMLSAMRAEYEGGGTAIGIYGGGGAFYVAVLRDGGAMEAALPGASAAYRGLDVAVLHKLILEELLGIDDEALAKGGKLEYIKDTLTAIDEAVDRVDSGLKQAAFFTNPVRLEQLVEVTEAGERMPQKSTYFYPKMYTGLVMNKL